MAYGNQPWVQKSWDERAAGNFIFGGAGAGLLVFNGLAAAQGQAWRSLWLVGLALVALGLLLVWAEIGRPWRAFNVFLNPGQSWMSREAYVALVLIIAALLTAAGVTVLAAATVLLALGFVWCQAHILRAARGIVAWREPATLVLIGLTALAEGGGLFVAMMAGFGWHAPWALLGLIVVLIARTVWAVHWQRRLQQAWAPRPVRMLRVLAMPLLAGGVLALPLLLVAAAAGDGSVGRAAGLVGGGVALASGAWFKLLLITQGAYNQGFALTKLPVRGVRRAPAPR